MKSLSFEIARLTAWAAKRRKGRHIHMPRLEATSTHYIKLGRGGEWEAEAIRDGVLRFGYRELPHDLCIAGEWEAAREAWRAHRGGNESVLTSDMNQVHTFYTAPETAVFITFHAGRMYWCRPRGLAELLPDGTKLRGTVDGWHGQTVRGEDLFFEHLSGRLLKVQGFRGTICAVEAEDYLLRKLGDEVTPRYCNLTSGNSLEVRGMSPCRGAPRQGLPILVFHGVAKPPWRR
ncbi:MAG: hypothetical protein K0B16_12885, partial [Burkholderiaceae bacterium]|nr:hypothetical protein [Burkholderiaceae bacterium]